MSDEPVSQMIRVPTPLVDAVRELARLHRQGRTKAVLEGVQRLIQAIDSDTDIDIDSMGETISRLSEKLDRLEAKQSESINIDVDRFAHAVFTIDKRLEKVEDDISPIARMITDLNERVSDLEGVGDIGYTVTPLSELELLDDISQDSAVTAEQQNLNGISSDIEKIVEPDAITIDDQSIAEVELSTDIDTDSKGRVVPEPPVPLTQAALAKRLSVSDKTVENRRRAGKENFAQWSGDRDPENIPWTWEGTGGRGQPLRFIPLD